MEGPEVVGMRRSSRFYAPSGLSFAEESVRADRHRAAEQALRDASKVSVEGVCPECGRKCRQEAAGAPEPCFLCVHSPRGTRGAA